MVALATFVRPPRESTKLLVVIARVAMSEEGITSPRTSPAPLVHLAYLVEAKLCLLTTIVPALRILESLDRSRPCMEISGRFLVPQWARVAITQTLLLVPLMSKVHLWTGSPLGVGRLVRVSALSATPLKVLHLQSVGVTVMVFLRVFVLSYVWTRRFRLLHLEWLHRNLVAAGAIRRMSRLKLPIRAWERTAARLVRAMALSR